LSSQPLGTDLVNGTPADPFITVSFTEEEDNLGESYLSFV